MPAGLFGTDGIRGISGLFPVDKRGAGKIGSAIARVFLKKGGESRVVIGRDTRKRGKTLQENLCGGLMSGGAKTVCAGICPTPAIVSLLLEQKADAGIMISASHNPPEYNGFKIFNSKGFKIDRNVETEIENVFEELKDAPALESSERKVAENSAWRQIYSCSLESSVCGKRNLSGIKIALDCGNGAMFEIAPEVFEKTGAQLSHTGREPDGENINKGCGSLETGRLAEDVKKNGAFLGAALDGDGDRVTFCDENGNEVDGDRIIALFAREMLENGTLKKPCVVTTVMSNKGLELFFEKNGIHMLRTDVGDRNVAEAMKRENINLGGEKSGHLIFSDHSTNGDGLLAALFVADIVKRKNKPLSQILPEFEMFPQILKNVRVSRRKEFELISGLPETVAKLEKQLGKGGRIHLRYSGTEPLARILVEGASQNSVEKTVDEISAVIESSVGEKSGGTQC